MPTALPPTAPMDPAQWDPWPSVSGMHKRDTEEGRWACCRPAQHTAQQAQGQFSCGQAYAAPPPLVTHR